MQQFTNLLIWISKLNFKVNLKILFLNNIISFIYQKLDFSCSFFLTFKGMNDDYREWGIFFFAYAVFPAETMPTDLWTAEPSVFLSVMQNQLHKLA